MRNMKWKTPFSSAGYNVDNAACRVVTEDFVYPTDAHGRRYGWGWSLLTTPEALFGREACASDRSPEASLELLRTHFKELLPWLSDKKIDCLIG